MLSEPALVLVANKDVLWLETSRKAACGKCSVKGGCGQYLLGNETDQLHLNPCTLDINVSGLAPGARVMLAMPQGAVARLALVFYCLPLLLLLLFTLVAGVLNASEGLVIITALTGLLAGWLLLAPALRFLNRQGNCKPLLQLPGSDGQDLKQ